MKDTFIKITILLVVFFAFSAFVVKASSVVPENVKVFETYGGLICVTDIRYENPYTRCYCPCEFYECEVEKVKNTPKATKTESPKETEEPTPTILPTILPTETPEEACYQWLCHKPGTPAEQDYCCDSDGCVNAHLGHGDYLGKCKGD